MKYPLRRVYLEITNVCNLSCAFCHGTARPPRFMSAAEFACAARKIRPYTEYVYLHLLGEPLLHPELDAILSAAESIGLHVALTTNGMLLPQTEAVLRQHRIYKMSISLHAWEANFGGEMTTAAERYFRDCFHAAADTAARGGIAALRLWNGDREDRCGANRLNPAIRELLQAYFPAPWRESPRGITLAERCFLETAEIFDWPDREAAETGSRVACYGTRDHVGILCDGTVVPCCLDAEGDVPLGNIFRDDFGAILETPRFVRMRDGFRRGEATEELCRRCGYGARR